MSTVTMEPVLRLTKELKEKSKTLNDQEARFLVDSYYQMQDNRIRADGQLRACEQSVDDAPNDVLQWLSDNNTVLENNIKRALNAYASASPLGEWAMSVDGIGPVIAAGLLAHIDLNRAKTAGAVWRFAGLDPTSIWEKGKKRPWNAALKTLCWKIGESFVKVSNKESSRYGRLYRERKVQEWDRNLKGEFADQAKVKMEKVAKSTDAWKFYAGCYAGQQVSELLAQEISVTEWKPKLDKLEPGTGTMMLPPAHINARAKRHAVKIFLAHYHTMGYRLILKRQPPVPFAIAILGHAHEIEP